MIFHEFFSFEIDALLGPAYDFKSPFFVHETDYITEQVAE